MEAGKGGVGKGGVFGHGGLEGGGEGVDEDINGGVGESLHLHD